MKTQKPLHKPELTDKQIMHQIVEKVEHFKSDDVSLVLLVLNDATKKSMLKVYFPSAEDKMRAAAHMHQFAERLEKEAIEQQFGMRTSAPDSAVTPAPSDLPGAGTDAPPIEGLPPVKSNFPSMN